MLKLAVIEDEQRDYDTLERHLKRFQEEQSVPLSVTRFYEAESFLSATGKSFDIVFMDIELAGGMNGLEASRKFRRNNDASVLIFVTNMAQYAIKGYEVDALDFVVKPVVYSSFETKMCKAIRHVHSAKETWLKLPTRTGVIQLRVSDIRYIEVTGHYLHYYTGEGVADVCGSLSEAEQKLAGAGFSRCNKSYLVNLRYVNGIGAKTVTVDGTPLSISRSYRKSFMEDFVRRIGE